MNYYACKEIEYTKMSKDMYIEVSIASNICKTKCNLNENLNLVN